ncbi:MAG: cytochrome c3 family protein [Terracidiphilus sp.]
MRSSNSGDSGDPDASCVPCHNAIYQRYRKTPMANASGPAAQGVLSADFTHTISGVHYTITQQGGRVWLTYTRNDPTRPLSGRRELRYFLGSGKRGRTYLFEQRGYWFEAPINWYAKKRIWDMAPNFQSTKEMPLTLPVDPDCLHCHASSVASSLPDARNHYAAAPFRYGGITCESCHGNAEAHVTSRGRAQMLNLDTLPPIRRDSICLNCHLEGKTAVDHEGKRAQDFRPGDNLFDYTVSFVYGAESGSGGRATSQWEALLKSACLRKSGDRMTCTTCHDPHAPPAPEERVAFYRQKCLQCHNTSRFAASHHPENQDCTSCHMARPPSNDIAHEQVTDHWIRKRISEDRLPVVNTGELVPVGGMPASDRDLGLAYAQMAQRGDHAAAQRAVALLRRSEQASGAQDDHQLHAQLGFLEQVSGDNNDAAEEYRQALHADPWDELAAGDLALIEAQQHRITEAQQAWRTIFDHDPAQVGAGLNLAIIECAEGERDAAIHTLDDLLGFSPDDDRARTLKDEILAGKQRCGAK